MPRRPHIPAYKPEVGEVVRDIAHRSPGGTPAEGVYMDTLGGLAYLRPERGGCEWTTRPEDLRRLELPRLVPVQQPSRPRAHDAA